MTILVAIRTAHDVVFAADSRVVFEGDSSDDRVFDTATKLVTDESSTVLAGLAGDSNLNGFDVLGLIQSTRMATASTEEEQDNKLAEFLGSLYLRPEGWGQGSENDLEGRATLLLAAASPVRPVPRVWKIVLTNKGHELPVPILDHPGIETLGADTEIQSLLWGYSDTFAHALIEKAGVAHLTLLTAATPPLSQVPWEHLPLQEAMALATFLANIPIQFGRFLCKRASCGGQVDLIALRTFPKFELRTFLKPLVAPK